MLGPLLGYRHIPSHYTKCHIITSPCHLFLFLMSIWQDVGVGRSISGSIFASEMTETAVFVSRIKDQILSKSILSLTHDCLKAFLCEMLQEESHTDLSLCLFPFERRELDERFYPIREEGRLSSATPQRAFHLLFWGTCFIFTGVQLVLCCITLMHKNGDSLPLYLIYLPTHPAFFLLRLTKPPESI